MTERTMANQQIQFQHGISIPEFLRSFGDGTCSRGTQTPPQATARRR